MPGVNECGDVIVNLEGARDIFLGDTKDFLYNVYTEKGNIGFFEHRSPFIYEFITNLGRYKINKIKGSWKSGIFSNIQLEDQTVLKWEQGWLDWYPKCIDMIGNEYILKDRWFPMVLEFHNLDEEIILSIKQQLLSYPLRLKIYLKPRIKITKEIVGLLYVLIRDYLLPSGAV
jgi:hypothetical protein